MRQAARKRGRPTEERQGGERAPVEGQGVGGFAIYDVASMDEVKEWTRLFLDVHIEHFPGWDCEVEIQQMMDDS